jgi:DNA replication and repair protein RecF
MGLVVERLELVEWRNHARRELTLDPALTILTGPNATGKTNTIEALELLTTGTTFKRALSREQLREGAVQGGCFATLTGDGRVIDVACTVAEKSRRFTRNNKPVKGYELLGTLLSVVFCPDDLTFVKGSASVRREELDGFACQANQGYRQVLRTYMKSIEQRNRLLKEGVYDPGLLAAWDSSVAVGAATLLYHRMRLFERLKPLVAARYAAISGGEELRAEYHATLREYGEVTAASSKEELQEVAERALAASRERDLARKQTCVGPHRDDFEFLLDGRGARRFGSQGQQRSCVLAYKLAQVDLAEELLGQRPLVLLDDVMSELDERRRAAVEACVAHGVQTVITTTHLGYFSQDLLDQAQVIAYGA